jgi:HEAT repeat protein
VAAIAGDSDEDVYNRLEAVSYLVSVCGARAPDLFRTYITSADPQTQLEAIIALGEAETSEAVALLAEILDDPQRPYFLRSAAAWSLSRLHSAEACSRLIRAFADVDPDIREEALDGVVSVGGPAVPLLLAGIRGSDREIAAGCAESLRQQSALPDEVLREITDDLRIGPSSPWTTWLVGNLPRERVASAIADLQRAAPHLHYAVSVLWSFVESWIARRWELVDSRGQDCPT